MMPLFPALMLWLESQLRLFSSFLAGVVGRNFGVVDVAWDGMLRLVLAFEIPSGLANAVPILNPRATVDGSDYVDNRYSMAGVPCGSEADLKS